MCDWPDHCNYLLLLLRQHYCYQHHPWVPKTLLVLPKRKRMYSISRKSSNLCSLFKQHVLLFSVMYIIQAAAKNQRELNYDLWYFNSTNLENDIWSLNIYPASRVSLESARRVLNIEINLYTAQLRLQKLGKEIIHWTPFSHNRIISVGQINNLTYTSNKF